VERTTGIGPDGARSESLGGVGGHRPADRSGRHQVGADSTLRPESPLICTQPQPSRPARCRIAPPSGSSQPRTIVMPRSRLYR